MDWLLHLIERAISPIIGAINNVLWNYVLIYGLLAVGIFFTVSLRVVQVRRFTHMLKVIGRGTDGDNAGISPFQALCTSLAARVGTGNLAGVAIAMSLGGPGALFWMWCTAAVGMATAYAESSLAQLYKVRDENGQYRGGPAYYIARGLRAPKMGWAFAACLLFSYGVVFNGVHANAIAQSVGETFKFSQTTVAVVLVVLTGTIIFGGLRSIAKVAEWVVPFMSVGYIGLAVWALVAHYDQIPAAVMLILRGAFGLDQAAGGIAGGMAAAMLNGVKRGLYANEAGMGSAPNIAAAATPVPHHPSSQGFVQSLGVFFDTMFICTATGLIVLLSGVLGQGGDGVVITQRAMTVFFGEWGAWFASIALFFFAFTTILGNYSYAESGLLYIGGGRKSLFVLRIVALCVIVWGVFSKVQLVWDAADAAMAVMATLNLIAVLLLWKVVVKLTRDYDRQLDEGKSPEFLISQYPELGHGVDHEIWRERHKPGA
ncbi:alanine/glycine:cation symporter family protein [Lysobacter enzymogenes]|uniref:Alanine or glycine:cation symporter, AGCS family n=1 Tax=Lysobacter enzymogenes TaxID=69 RepID=A0AAU9ASD2_LYSEN|nr:sodium:alanine symporter family protein [Lysobacter enzymogenes]BAV99685.1 alanine or glycine:cation symporter, AGCS family [Lysobacter enzymogenes]